MKSLTRKFLLIALLALYLQYLFVTNVSLAFLYIDEAIVVLLVPAFIISAFKNLKLLISFYLFILLGLLLFMIHQYNGNAILDCINFCKPIMLFYGLYYLFYQIEYKQLNKILNIFVILFKIALIYGILQWIVYFLFKIELPMLNLAHVSGSEEFLGGEKFGIRRVNSIFGFHLWFAYLCACFGGYFFYRKMYVWVLLCLGGILCAFSRFGLALFVLSIIITLLQKKNTKYIATIIGSCALICIFYYWEEIMHLYDIFWGTYNDNAIKMLSIKQGINLFIENPFGYGFGSFGTQYSVESNLNGLLNFDGKASGAESYYLILLVQVGLFGLLFYLFPFVYHFYTQKKSRYLMGLILLFPLISTFYNPIFLAMTSLIIVWLERGNESNFRCIQDK